jgi:hypothetical protein
MFLFVLFFLFIIRQRLAVGLVLNFYSLLFWSFAAVFCLFSRPFGVGLGSLSSLPLSLLERLGRVLVHVARLAAVLAVLSNPPRVVVVQVRDVRHACLGHKLLEDAQLSLHVWGLIAI